MKRNMMIAAVIAVVILIGLLAVHGAKPTEKAAYLLELSGSVEESGVIEYAGMEMNVYLDLAHNPCGTCSEQPVSVYAGADAGEVIEAMAKAIERADDIWTVKEKTKTSLLLEEKELSTAEKPAEPTAPAGLSITGTFTAAHFSRASSDVQTRTITHIDDSKIEVPLEPQRIGAIYGPSYEALAVLGAEEKIVVCSDVQFENFPWAKKIFPRITQLPYLKNVHAAVSVETLLSYKPDLVFTFARPNELRQLKAAGAAAVEGLTTENLNDTKDLLTVYAKALGKDAEKRAQDYSNYFDERVKYIRSVTDKIPESERPRVYYAGIDMLTTYGKYSDICELIETAGGMFVSEELEAGNHTQISFEQLAAWNPQYIFVDHGGMNDKDSVEEIISKTYGDQRYQAIDAVKNKQIYLSPSGVFYWDMGLQKILLLQYVAKTIHPEAFTDLDMTEEIKYFYSEFFDYQLTDDEAEKILNRRDP